MSQDRTRRHNIVDIDFQENVNLAQSLFVFQQFKFEEKKSFIKNILIINSKYFGILFQSLFSLLKIVLNILDFYIEILQNFT